jgi:hypothetical protein
MYPPPTIPRDWSPAQALAVYEFLDQLCEGIAECYPEALIEAQHQRAEEQDNAERQLCLPWYPFNDEIPF